MTRYNYLSWTTMLLGLILCVILPTSVRGYQLHPSVQQLFGGETVAFRRWVTAPGRVDLSAIVFDGLDLGPYAGPYQTQAPSWNETDDSYEDVHDGKDYAFYLGASVGMQNDGVMFHHLQYTLECCHEQAKRNGDCSGALNEPYIEKWNTDTLLPPPTLFISKVSPDETQSLQNPSWTYAVNQSGFYEVSFTFCEGSYGSYNGWPRIEMKGRPDFVSDNGDGLSKNLSRYLMVAVALTIAYGIATAWLFQTKFWPLLERDIVKLTIGILVSSMVESALRVADLLLLRRTSAWSTPLIPWIFFARAIRVGLLSIYLVALTSGSDLFRRGCSRDNCIKLIGSVCFVAGIASSHIRYWNVDTLISLILVISMLTSLILSWRFLRNSTSALVSQHQIVAYRTLLCRLVVFGFVTPLLSGSSFFYYYKSFDALILPSLGPFTWSWPQLVIWHWSTLWFLCSTIRIWIQAQHPIRHDYGGQIDTGGGTNNETTGTGNNVSESHNDEPEIELGPQ